MNILIILYIIFVPIHIIVFYANEKDLVKHKNFIYDTDTYEISRKRVILRSVGFPIFWTSFIINMIIQMIKDYRDMKKLHKEIEESETMEDLIKCAEKGIEIIDR